MSREVKTRCRQMKTVIRDIAIWAVIIAIMIWKIIHGASIGDIVPPGLFVFLLLANTARKNNL